MQNTDIYIYIYIYIYTYMYMRKNQTLRGTNIIYFGTKRFSGKGFISTKLGKLRLVKFIQQAVKVC